MDDTCVLDADMLNQTKIRLNLAPSSVQIWVRALQVQIHARLTALLKLIEQRPCTLVEFQIQDRCGAAETTYLNDEHKVRLDMEYIYEQSESTTTLV
jgi:hypothetical protein